jgi:hypothetical protein
MLAKEIEENYNDVWKQIIENNDGSLNLDQIKKELFDYWNFMEDCSLVYSHVTGGRISKPNTKAFEVISEADHYYSTQEG